MESWLWIIAAVVVAAILFAAALCKVAGKCSREEEQAEYERRNR